MRVLVTGVTGLVGSTVASDLEGSGHEVVGLSRRGRDDAPADLAIDLGEPGAGDRLAGAPACDAVVHAAAAITDDPHSPAVSLVNGLGTQACLAAAERWGAGIFVYLSSANVIGLPRRLPVDEDHPVDPPTAYHAAKLYGEHLVELAGRRGMAACSLRLTSPVGPGMPGGRIFSVFVHRAVAGEPLEVAGAGTRRQDYIATADVATAVRACLERKATGVMNVASGDAVSNEELARRCIEVLGSESEVRVGGRDDPEDGVSWEMSIDRARERLGWRPHVTLAESITAAARPRPR